MEKNNQQIDIINEVLEECILAYPISPFIISLYQQYQQRGSLSKKQLQGLLGKAAKTKKIAPAKLATLEAIINRMPTRFASEAPAHVPLYEKEKSVGELIEAILNRFPQHKRVLYLKSKYENNEALSTADLADLKRFKQLLT
jgi:hypothetical protein